MSEVEQKNCCPVVISKDQIIPGTEFYDMWNVGSAPDYKAQVPIFSVYNCLLYTSPSPRDRG